MDESQPMQKVHIASYTILSDWVAIINNFLDIDFGRHLM